MRKSLVTICPRDVRESLLHLGRAYGIEAGMSVELSADGSAPATHYGSHAWVSPEFAAIVTQQVVYVPESYTQEQVSAILDACTFGVSAEPGPINREHFDDVLEALDLKVIEVKMT